MRAVTLRVESTIFAAPDVVWAELTAIENMTSFVGFGPIPGIKSAAWLSGDGASLGAVRRVTNRDGSTHKEAIVEFEPGRCVEDRIYDFDSPVRFLLKEIRDRFVLASAGAGTRLERRVIFVAKGPWAWPATRLLSALFRRAAERQHAVLANICARASG